MQSEPWTESLSSGVLCDLISEGFLVVDESLVVMYANLAFTTMAEFSKDDIKGRSLPELVGEASREKLETLLRESGNGTISELEIDWTTHSGSVVPTTVRVGSIADSEHNTRWGFLLVSEQTQQALTEDEARYRLVFENLADGVFQTDQDGVVTMSTAKGAEIFGYTVEELEGKNFTVLLHPDDLPGIIYAFTESRDRLETVPGGFEAKGIRKDGSTIHFHITNTVLVKGGEFQGYQSLVRDVTIRKEAEEALRESEELYRGLVDTSPDAITLTDLEGNLIFVNDQALILYGASSKEELVGVSRSELIAREDHERAMENLKRTLAEGAVRNVQYTMLRRDGSRFPAEMSTAVVRDAQGNPKAFIGIIRDVTDHVEAIMDLRESEERFALFAENIPGPVFIKDEDSNMLYANSFMRSRFGIEDWSGKNTMDLYPEELAASMVEDDRRTLAEGPMQVLQRVPDKDEVIHSYRTSKFPIRRKGKPTLLGGVAFDITDIDRAEKALRESEEQYRTTLLAIGDPIHVVDLDLRVVLSNPVLENWIEELNLDVEILGKRLPDIFPFLPDNVLDEYETVFQSKETLVSEERTLLGGKEIFTEVTKVPIIRKGEVEQVLTIIRDISEARRAELALKDSEAKYKQLVEQYTQGVAIIQGPPLSMPFANRAFGTILEMLPEDIMTLASDQIQSLIHPEDYEDLMTRFVGLMEGNPSGNVPREFRIVRPSGEVRFVAVLGRRVEYEGQYAVQMAIEDVTERLRAERELRKSEERYRSLVEESLQGLAIIQDGRYMYVNPAFAETLGYSVDALLQFSEEDVWNHIHPDDREELHRRNEAVAIGEEISPRHRFRYVREDGSTRYVESFVQEIEFEGKPALQVMDIDITGRMMSERALRESEAKYRQLVEQSPLGILIVKGLPLEIAFANNAMVEMTGHPLERLLALSAKDMEGLIHPDDFEPLAEMFAGVLGGEPTLDHPLVMRVIQSDGRMLWVEAVGHKIQFEEGVAVQATIVDITERVIAERERDRAEMELKTAAETSMLYLDLLGHDTRNKLQAIQMSIELLQFDETRPAAYGLIDRIMDLVQSAEALIDKAHATRGLLTAPLETISLKDALVAAVGALKFKHDDVEVEADYQVDEANVKADEYIGHLFTNVLENAILHNPAETKHVWVSLKEIGGGFEVSIADDGTGIDDAMKAALFDQDRRYGGLGVHQAKRILAKYGGKIEVTDRVEGQPEKGALFRLWFPGTIS
ncbi:MAG: PAS domain S-box protein [Candidatus Thorarchaeota archaeon]|jgi:PAS domain S-box-containing protein